MVMIFVTVNVSECFAGAGNGLTNGKGKTGIDLIYFDQEIENDMTYASSISVANWNCDYESIYKRDGILLRGSYGILEQLDGIIGLGISDEEDIARRSDGSVCDEIQSGEGDFLWEIGLKGTLCKWSSGIYVGGATCYSEWESGDTYRNASGSNSPRDTSIEWKELTVNLELGWKAEKCSSFVGLEFLTLEGRQTLRDYPLSPGVQYIYEYENEDNWGGFAGFNIKVVEKIDVNFTVHFGAQKRYDIGGRYTF